MSDIVLVKSVRTPVGRFLGGLSQFNALDLGAMVIRDLMEQTKLDPGLVDGVICGWAAQDYAAKDVAREAALRAGLPESIVGWTVQRNCATGMEALSYAQTRIRAGKGEVYIIAGVESLSNVPNSLPRGIDRQRDLLGSRTFYDPLFEGLTDPHARMLMGGVANYMAHKYGISKQEQDQVALWSHQRAHEGEARLREEMVSAELLGTLPIQKDEGVRAGLTLENLTALQPFTPFAEQFLAYIREQDPDATGIPTVTPANASQISDGGIAALVMTEERAKALGYAPLAYVKGIDFTAVRPDHFPVAPAYSMLNAAKAAGLDLKDVSLWDINEAFAVVPIASGRVLREHGFELDLENVNVNGGACAIGHPLGASGLRILTTVAYEMQRRDAQYGMASICVQGGLGGTTILERR